MEEIKKTDNPSKLSRLETKLISQKRKSDNSVILVYKNPKPLFIPKEKNYLSIRNPGAFVYQNKIGLLYTIRTKKEPKNSELYLAWSEDGKNFEIEDKPFIKRNKDSQIATEDARITKIKDEYWITFTSAKEKTKDEQWVLRTGLVKTKDFKEYYDRQIILDDKEENKNALFFKNNEYHFIVDRPFQKHSNEKPWAEISKVKKLNPLKIEKSKKFLSPRTGNWDSARVGINTPAIEIEHEKYGKCFFMLYHGAEEKTNTYRMGYIIVDKKDPQKILEHPSSYILEPEFDWETGKGKYNAEVPNVIFGCGAIPINKNTLRFYYSGADKYPSFADIELINARIMDPIFKNSNHPKT